MLSLRSLIWTGLCCHRQRTVLTALGRRRRFWCWCWSVLAPSSRSYWIEPSRKRRLTPKSFRSERLAVMLKHDTSFVPLLTFGRMAPLYSAAVLGSCRNCLLLMLLVWRPTMMHLCFIYLQANFATAVCCLLQPAHLPGNCFRSGPCCFALHLLRCVFCIHVRSATTMDMCMHCLVISFCSAAANLNTAEAASPHVLRQVLTAGFQILCSQKLRINAYTFLLSCALA